PARSARGERPVHAGPAVPRRRAPRRLGRRVRAVRRARGRARGRRARRGGDFLGERREARRSQAQRGGLSETEPERRARAEDARARRVKAALRRTLRGPLLVVLRAALVATTVALASGRANAGEGIVVTSRGCADIDEAEVTRLLALDLAEV